MRRFAALVVVVAVALAFPHVASAQKGAESGCPATWHYGTLVTVSTPGEPGGEVEHLYVKPGYGMEADQCIAHPERCERLPCPGAGCTDAWSLHCHRYLVSDCLCDDKPAEIIEFVRLSDIAGPCP